MSRHGQVRPLETKHSDAFWQQAKKSQKDLIKTKKGPFSNCDPNS